MVSATHIVYYHLCHRKLWLFHNHIRMENATGNKYVKEGKLIDESTYARRPNRWRELNLGYSKIDHYDPVENIVREVKKSPKLEYAHIAQVKYYLHVLEQRGVGGARGVVEYPKLRKKTIVEYTPSDRLTIERWLEEIERITS